MADTGTSASMSVCLCVWSKAGAVLTCVLVLTCVYLVFLSLIERMLDQRLPRRGSNRDTVTVTLFQLWTYLDANDISDVETHIAELGEEGIYLTHTHTEVNECNPVSCPAVINSDNLPSTSVADAEAGVL